MLGGRGRGRVLFGDATVQTQVCLQQGKKDGGGILKDIFLNTSLSQGVNNTIRHSFKT